jgi:CDP-diacylglycerol--glycerol-3-phosphate 3-phosphatidyltransferase|tara:strand:+ start:1220 stop:1813 length:594 start_codon:yes stop_codon:yes gene_type:complete
LELDKANNMNDVEFNDPSRVLTLANFISMLRALSAIPIIYSLAYPEWNWITGFLILFAVLSDALDGYFARKAKAITHFGKWIDPAADFIVIISVLVYLVGVNQFPIWFFCFYLLRHIVIAGFAIYCMNYEYMILHSNWWGKWSVNITALGIFLHIFELPDLPWLKMTAVYAATFLLAVSLYQYLVQFINSIKDGRAQ